MDHSCGRGVDFEEVLPAAGLHWVAVKKLKVSYQNGYICNS